MVVCSCLLSVCVPPFRDFTQHFEVPRLNSSVFRGLSCGVDVCWSSLDTHWPFVCLWLSVLLLLPESCPGLVMHFGEDPAGISVCVQFAYLY